ncbi:MAG: 1,4-dihydroxy-2-naphthoate polyprenyltransferase [Nitriliruptorales bacterium]|nr:1,4-dihydroxy-2-naphthoate polyprenyltransferase [Nitriliruptorales bacterium]
MTGRVWIQAARPRTFPAAIAPVVVGTAAARQFTGWRFSAALLVALAMQVAVNYANDYFDGVRGVDTAERVGPRRAVASGDASPQAMKVAIAAALLVAAVAGLALAAAAGWELLAVGAVSFLAALAYSGGPRPYASAGLGEVFVFVFFGLVATVGSAYVQDERVAGAAVAAALPVGALASAILMVNNLRDIGTDRAAGKMTLAVRLGEQRSRSAYWSLVGGAYVGACVVAGAVSSAWPLLALASLPLLLPLRARVRAGASGADLIAALGGTGRLELVFAVLFAAGLVLAR